MSLWDRVRRVIRARQAVKSEVAAEELIEHPGSRRALVVSWHPAFGAAAADALVSAGFDVARCVSPAESSEIAPKHRPELVVYLPRDSDPDEHHALRRSARDAAVVLILPVQAPTRSLVPILDDTGAAGWVEAPFSPTQLLEAVREALSADPLDVARRRQRIEALRGMSR